MLTHVEPVDDRVDARGAVDDVQRRVEAFFDDRARGDLGGYSDTSEYLCALIRQRRCVKVGQTLRALIAEGLASRQAELLEPGFFERYA